jgi:hypothetical protein
MAERAFSFLFARKRESCFGDWQCALKKEKGRLVEIGA